VKSAAVIPADPNATEDSETPIGRNQTIQLVVECLDSYLSASKVTCKDLRLYLGGQKLAEVPISSCDEKTGVVTFQLRRDGRDGKQWGTLFADRWDLTPTLAVSVGVKDDLPLPSQAMRRIEVASQTRILLCLLVALITLGLVVWMAQTSDMLRDRLLPDQVLLADQRPSYSLARTQMAFWTVLVVAAFLLIFSVTDSTPTIPAKVLILLGVSSVTALGAVAIDANPPGGPQPVRPSQGFILDVLSDSQGVSLHRLQMFVWTIVLGVVFLWTTLSTLAMPEFDDTLLALTGIASGTYLGFKIPEK
jgi:hypothetical protein